MVFRASIVVLGILLCGNAMHPVHVTITNIDFNSKSRAFDVSIKVFADDLENVIRRNSNVSLNLGKPNEISDAEDLLKKYITDNFNISINSDKFAGKKLKLVRKEMKEGAIWLYFNYPLNKRIETLQVNNTLLNDYYPDMTNLVIIKVNETETGYTLNKNTTSFKIAA